MSLVRIGLICLLAICALANSVSAQPDGDKSKLPKLEEMELPSAETLLTDDPRDWVVLNTDEVIVSDSVAPRPNTLQRLQEETEKKEEERRRAPGPDRERLQKEIEELNYLTLTVPAQRGNPEFRIPLRRVKEIIHHEDLVLRRVQALLDARDVESALELLTRLERTWDDWPGLKEAGENALQVDALRRLEAGRPEAALVALDELQRRNRKYPGLPDLYGQATQMLVQQALQEENFPAVHFFLNRLQQTFPDHPVFRAFDQQLSQRAREHLGLAAAAAQRGNHRQAMVEAEQAARIWPRTTELRSGFRPFADRFQRLHVGVVDRPGECRAYPVAAPADLRRQRLTRMSLFEIDRVRDGTAYYRTRFFDEWEPRDLGRQMRFTLRQIRQPYELQGAVSTADVVAPLLRRLDPNEPEYDERLASFIESVDVTSPLEFTLTFRHVPPRLEPLLAELQLPPPTQEERETTPLIDPGGFAVSLNDPQQTIYLRKLPEPDGVPRFHVAEIVEHVYPDYDAAVQGLNRGEVSMLVGLPDWIIRRMQLDEEFLKRFFVVPCVLPESHLLQFNPASKPLRVRELRTALAYAVDQDRLLRDIVLQDPQKQHGRIVTTPFLSNSPGRNVLISPRRYDLSSALAMLLAAKKQLNGEIPELTMVVAPGPVPLAAAQEIARVWRHIGLKIKVVRADEAPPAKWDILYRTLQMTEPIAEMWPFLTFQPQARISDLDIYPDWLKQELVELDRTSDQTRAVEALQLLHRRLWDDTAYVPLWEIDQFLVLRKNIQGFPPNPIHCYDRIDRWSIEPFYQTELQ